VPVCQRQLTARTALITPSRGWCTAEGIAMTDHDLRQLFEPYGAVDKITIVTDRDTGRAPGGLALWTCPTAARRRPPYRGSRAKYLPAAP
jgi:hypothetical protein